MSLYMCRPESKMQQKLYGFIKIREFMYRERSRRNGTKKGERSGKKLKPKIKWINLFQITF
jgi:hypothetical protein